MVGTPELAALKIAGSTSALCILVHVREFLDLANRCVLEVPLLNFILPWPHGTRTFSLERQECARRNFRVRAFSTGGTLFRVEPGTSIRLNLSQLKSTSALAIQLRLRELVASAWILGFVDESGNSSGQGFSFFGNTQFALEVEVSIQKSLPKPSSATGGEFLVKKVRLPQNSVDVEGKNSVSGSASFVFCEKSTGVAKFRAESNDDPNSTIERIAGQLAMQCLVRGHEPEDFVVLVPAEGPIVGRFLSRAKELLEEGRAVSRPATLSPRQSEILLSVIRNRANKEIASKLNITVRTVKFHISSLLNKFGVDNRVELARRAAGLLKDGAEDAEGLAFRPGTESSERRQLGPVPVKSASCEASEKTRNIRFAGRQMMA